jgi:hypothetical protein
MIDRIEKIGRFILWLSIASAWVILPIAYFGQKRAETKAEAELQDAVKKAETKVEELEKGSKPKRIALASIGPYLAGLNYSTAQGNLWLSNVSAHGGIICVVAMAQDPDVSIKIAESLPACQEVASYASAVHISLMFGGGDLATACPKSNCRITFKEVVEHN